MNVPSLQFSDLVAPDSPQPPEKSSLKSLGARVHSSSGWTAPVAKQIDISASATLHTLGKLYNIISNLI